MVRGHSGLGTNGRCRQCAAVHSRRPTAAPRGCRRCMKTRRRRSTSMAPGRRDPGRGVTRCCATPVRSPGVTTATSTRLAYDGDQRRAGGLVLLSHTASAAAAAPPSSRDRRAGRHGGRAGRVRRRAAPSRTWRMTATAPTRRAPWIVGGPDTATAHPRLLVDTAYEALWRGHRRAATRQPHRRRVGRHRRPGRPGRIGVIYEHDGHAVGGHGIGRDMHEDPHGAGAGSGRPRHAPAAGAGVRDEPMFTLGRPGFRLIGRRLDPAYRRRRHRRPLGAHGRRHQRGPWVLSARPGEQRLIEHTRSATA